MIYTADKLGRYKCADVVAEYMLKEKIPYMLCYAGHGAIGRLDAFYEKQDKIKIVWPRIETAEENRFLALIGPFAALGWQAMIQYYACPSFRRFTACFDPWHRWKMNINRGGLFTYFDWFFRDVYGLKFIIPEEFALSLQDMGLLRRNDER
jgi:hypothetical protein